ncbi:response regulator [Myceligenerans pegani]|uniref:Response regulator transcription factor n=1 Tax=Myceligenerans pegani TaxID=2776917 RepID=A0ABR9N3Q9_9MICO|nr:response regulator transcription factor [Myceligenerans sp. TRM 65318]MBE1877642.1 response regulator transcription factor [Myceligenerans sp. TRM 65318]MBE3019913.1 response regulator transcription factor [Myceligenerans sp. TRM 65318]
MITTLVVDDAGSVRRSLRLLLETTDDIRVVGEASNGADAVRLARTLRPDVVLMDLRMPGGGGLDAIEALSGPGVTDPIPVLVFTTFHLDEYLYGAFERGAVGYLLKKNPGDIPAAIRAAVNASALQSPAVRERLLAEYARSSGRTRREGSPEPAAPTGDPADPGPGGAAGAGGAAGESIADLLTDRELEVVAALAEGLSNKQIATRLSLGENTVKWHIGNMLDKTGTRDRTQLAIWAYQHGLNP